MMRRRDLLAALLASPAWAHALHSWQPSPSRTILQRTEECLARIERLNPLLNAFVTTTPERARSDARRAMTGPQGPLAGMAIAHKDLFETSGIRTTAGSRLFATHVPSRDATIVSRLAAAGTVLMGKTNTHELGGGVTTINPFFGTTRNPWDVKRIPGGSSGGSAAAVAAGLVTAATGSDTGGSVRIPAALCGCVGLKPTYGRISTAGLMGASPTFDHSGIITRTVADAMLVYQAVAGYDAADSSTVESAPDNRNALRTDALRTEALRTQPSALSTSSPLRIGVARNFFFDRLESDVARAIEQAIATFRGAKADVRDIMFPIDNDTMARVFDPIIVAEIHQTFEREWQQRPDAFSTAFAGFFRAPVPSGLELAAAHRALREYQSAVRRVFDAIDIVLTPTVAVTAPLIDGVIDGGLILRNTWPWNAARTPVLTMPCGFDQRRLPIGMQLVAAPFAEDTLFDAALTFEARTEFHLQRPAL